MAPTPLGLPQVPNGTMRKQCISTTSHTNAGREPAPICDPVAILFLKKRTQDSEADARLFTHLHTIGNNVVITRVDEFCFSFPTDFRPISRPSDRL